MIKNPDLYKNRIRKTQNILKDNELLLVFAATHRYKIGMLSINSDRIPTITT